jgi:hypothetical protein
MGLAEHALNSAAAHKIDAVRLVTGSAFPQQSGHDVCCRPSLDEDRLTPSSAPRLDVHGGPRQRQFAGEKSDQLLVGGASDRRRCDPNLERIAMNADARAMSRFGLNMNREEDTILAVQDQRVRITPLPWQDQNL